MLQPEGHQTAEEAHGERDDDRYRVDVAHVCASFLPVTAAQESDPATRRET
jgi:hypothetical protein